MLQIILKVEKGSSWDCRVNNKLPETQLLQGLTSTQIYDFYSFVDQCSLFSRNTLTSFFQLFFKSTLIIKV